MNESGRLRQWIVGVGALLIIAFFALSAWDAWRLHRQVERSTQRELANLARALSEEAERSLQNVDLLLTDTALSYREHGTRLSPEEIGTNLRDRAAATPQVSLLTLVDADGIQRYRSRTTGEPLADVSDRPYFRELRSPSQHGLFINPPLVTRSERRASLIAARRLGTPSGEFAGVVTATVTLDELREVYDAIDLGSGSSLLLTFEDGTLIVRQPPDPRADGRLFPELAASKSTAPRRVISPLDGREKFVVSVPVSERPLVMSVARDVYESMAPWRAELVGLVGRSVAMALAGLLTMWLILRQLSRLEAGERALRHSEQRYALAMDAANEGHAEWDLQQGTFYASERWLRLHELEPGVAPTDAMALMQVLALHPQDRADTRHAVDEHFAGRTPELDVEYRVQRRGTPGDDPQWRWIHARGRCLRDEAGRSTRFYSAVTDVTARKEAEDERERLGAQLRQAQHMEALGTLAGGIAHDFNNILGAILGHGEMAQKLAAGDARMGRHLDRVMQAGARAKLLVRRILDFSRSGVRDRGLVNVDRAVEDALLLVTPTLPSHVELHHRFEAGTAAVMGDASQIHQLVSNLCSNAVGAMPEGGRLDVVVEMKYFAQPQNFSHGRLRVGEYVGISVSDQGSGIAPDVQARMFDPFFSTKAVGEGTGLGLSVVHSIVADMDGAIDVQTEAGKGSCFTLWLPVAGRAEPAGAPGSEELPRGEGHVLMVVDDEAPLVEFAEEMLAELGYEPVGFTSSEQALKAFEANPARFDALLTDETMPQLSGVQLAARVRALRPELPVLVMSGYGGEELEQRVREVGARALVRKPLNSAELADAVAAVLQP